MRKCYLFSLLLLLMFAAAATESFAACHAVGPSATGTGSGSDWSNRMNKLPSSLVRGDTYYLMDGSYGKYSFSTANSGSTRITVKKAQSYDFGRTSDGCSNDISAGWDAGSMGSGQAQFTGFGGPNGTAGFITLDGNGNSTTAGCGTAPATNAAAKDCGIKFTDALGSDGPITIGVNGQRASGWTLRYIETQGAGDANNSQTEENLVRCAGACDNFLVEHVWWYNSGCDIIKLPWTTSATFRSSYFKQNFSASSCHGQFYLSEVNTSNVTFANNVIQDIQGTGMWVIVTGGQADNYNIYNNVILKTQGSSRPGFSNGFFACINSGAKCTNMKFIGNTVINYEADSSGAAGILNENNNGSSYTWQNNLFYNTSDIGFTLNGASFTEDHNTWLNSGTPANGNGDVRVTSGAPNPFVNWQNSDFRLVSENADWGAGAVLASPYNLDMIGNLRPGTDGVWDRGAFEFAGVQAQAPAPPTNLTAVVQ